MSANMVLAKRKPSPLAAERAARMTGRRIAKVIRT
jgi:hypothetical protein